MAHRQAAHLLLPAPAFDAGRAPFQKPVPIGAAGEQGDPLGLAAGPSGTFHAHLGACDRQAGLERGDGEAHPVRGLHAAENEIGDLHPHPGALRGAVQRAHAHQVGPGRALAADLLQMRL